MAARNARSFAYGNEIQHFAIAAATGVASPSSKAFRAVVSSAR